MLSLQDIVDSFFWAGNSFISTVVSGVGAANASQAKENCEEDRFLQNICDEYQPVAESGGAAAVSIYCFNFKAFIQPFMHSVVFFYCNVPGACGIGRLHDHLLGSKME